MRFLAAFLIFLPMAFAEQSVKAPWFGIRVVDEATGRGIPLIELRTVNDVRSITDSAGWIAFLEPGLMDREVWFYLSMSPGYEKEKDGFGYTGLRVKTTPGTSATVKLKRTNIAERIGRTTGQGIYRDSELLGLPTPLPSLGNASAMGSDSVQATPYQGHVFWLWGDTNLPHYPLGNFQTTAATTPLDVKPEQGIAFNYYVEAGRPDKIAHMLPLKEQGAVWLFGLLTIKDDQGGESLVSHWSRHKALAKWDEHGLARFNDKEKHFDVIKKLDIANEWQFPRGHAVRDGDWYYFSEGFPTTRVKATYADITNPASYEALRYESGAWRWQHEQPPTTQGDETKLLLQKQMPAADARYRLKDVVTNKLVRLHGGSVQWNAYRKRWVLIGLQSGDKDDPSPLGEVWYAESKSPEGPWNKTAKVASHPRYSYYNPIHHGFLDAEGGRIIYFEGTYSLEFSGNPLAPARYDYNELMYRLDLDDERVKAARVE